MARFAMPDVPVSRRGVLVGAAVGGGMVVAWGLRPRSFPDPLPEIEGEFSFDGWLRIAGDGVVTVAVPQLEMGQGVTTILPQIVAVELGADWRQVAVEPVPVSGAYANVPLAAAWAPMWLPLAGRGGLPSPVLSGDSLMATRFAQGRRFAATADGTTLAAYEIPARIAAASARSVLAMEAADRWDVPFEECTVEGGLVRHGDKRMPFTELVEDAAIRTPPDPPALRSEPAAEIPLPGQADAPTAFPRLDLPSKVDGSYLFAGDIRLPDMVYAAIKHGPVGDAELVSFDRDAAVRPELVQVVRGHDWLVAVATDGWSAERAVEAMKPRFKVRGAVDDAVMQVELDGALRARSSHRVAVRGEGDARMGTPSIAIRYDIAPALHGTIETTTATARFDDGRLELWLASQAPEQARVAAARAIGIAVEDVVLYPTPAGGSFDRRLEHDHAIEIALVAREVAENSETPRAVQLRWSRWQEHLAAPPRAPAAAMLSARVPQGGAGRIDTLHARIATPATTREFGVRLFDNATREAALDAARNAADPLALAGAMPHYDIPNAAIDHVPVSLGLPGGRMRGNGHAVTAFCMESFIDEIAATYAREPLSYRIAMLGGDPRMVVCLQRAAQLAQWDGGAGGSGQGLACHRIGPDDTGGRIACIATAQRDATGTGGAGGIRVTKLTAAVDIGRIVNLDIARQQIEGGLLFGMGLAVGCATGYAQGLPTAQRLAHLDMPTLANAPQVDVDFIVSEEAAFDPGELGVAVAAPAIANALHSATGLRFRSLPLSAA
ncbi:MAG: molybdopterin cofactor-binding domain-containing protein [Parerythrobacter sp.]